ncbi:MAG: hypothetical protein AAGG48_02435 [Planctomycetota bacterium]
MAGRQGLADSEAPVMRLQIPIEGGLSDIPMLGNRLKLRAFGIRPALTWRASQGEGT